MRHQIIVALTLAVILGLLKVASAQQAHQSIGLKAYLRPTVRLSQESFVLNFQLIKPTCAEMSFPLDISWNLDQTNAEVLVIAVFSISDSALRGPQGEGIAASAVEARVMDSPWKSFPETRAHVVNSGILLKTIRVEEFGRQAHQHIQLQFRICRQPTGEYHGRVELRAVIR